LSLRLGTVRARLPELVDLPFLRQPSVLVIECAACSAIPEHRTVPISLVAVEEIPLSRSAIYKKMGAGTFPRPVQLMGRSWWVKDEVDAWFDPEDTVQLILDRRDELQGGFTEAELRARRWRGLRDRGYNERALKVLVERGMLRRRKLSTGGRPRVEYQWCL